MLIAILCLRGKGNFTFLIIHYNTKAVKKASKYWLWYEIKHWPKSFKVKICGKFLGSVTSVDGFENCLKTKLIHVMDSVSPLSPFPLAQAQKLMQSSCENTSKLLKSLRVEKISKSSNQQADGWKFIIMQPKKMVSVIWNFKWKLFSW